MRTPRRFLLSLALLLVGSCGEQTTQPLDPDPDPDPDPEPEAICPDLGAVVASGMPLDEITLEGVPDDFEVLFAEVRSPATGETILTAVEPPSEGRVSLLVPVHPDLDPDGGQAEVVIGNSASSCEAVEITVDPLPAAVGEFGRGITSIAARLEEALGSAGNDLDDFYAEDLTDAPPHLVLYAAVHSLFAHPDRAESVLALATGAATSIDGDEVGTELLDRLAARIQLNEHLSTLPILVPDEAPPGSGAASATPARQEGTALSCPDGDFGLAWVQDTEDLSERMRTQYAAQRRLEGAAGKVQADLATLSAMFANSKHPVAAPLAKTLTVVLSKSQTMAEIARHLYPNDLETQLFLSPTEFNEDDPGPGRWTLVAIGTSDPWNLNKEVFKAALEKGLGNASVGKQALGSKAVEDPLLDAAASKIDDYVIKQPTDAALDRLMGAIGADQGDAGFVLPAGCWDGPDDEGYDLSEGGRTEVEVIGDAVYIADFDDEGLYYPDQVGTATIQVTTVSQAYGNEIFIERGDVEVKPIIVSVDPTSELVEPGDPVTYRAVVRNANDQSVTWSTSAGYFDVETTSADGQNEAILITPTERDPFPVRVTATSASRTGIRGRADAPERSNFGLATIEVQPFVVTGPPCLEPGDSWTFEAIGIDGSEVEVSWETDNGSFSSTEVGKYTAGSPGEATITATSVLDEDRSATVAVKIGTCTCSFRAQFVGYNSADISAEATLPPDEFDPYVHAIADVVLNEAGDLESVHFEGPIFGTAFSADWLRGNRDPVPGGSLGDFDVSGFASVQEVEPPPGGESIYFTVASGPAWWEPDWDPLTLSIYAWEDDLVRGSVQGIVLDIEHYDFELPTYVRVDFLALTKIGATTYSNCNPEFD